MKKLNLGILILAITICTLLALSCNAGSSATIPATTTNVSTVGHHYFTESNEFTINITDDLNSSSERGYPFPSQFEGRFVSQEVVIDKRASNTEKTAFIFETDNGSKAYILIPKGIVDSVNMLPTKIYQINIALAAGWPFGYRLVINRETELVFAGISIESFDSRLTLEGLIPITANLSKILKDNYVDGSEDVFWDRKTNTEITFTLDGYSVVLHQGQSAMLGDYQITLLIARQIQYKPNVYDAGQNGVSYVIIRD
jgi:hypothetical protein